MKTGRAIFVAELVMIFWRMGHKWCGGARKTKEEMTRINATSTVATTAWRSLRMVDSFEFKRTAWKNTQTILTIPGPPANSEEGALPRGSHSKPCKERDRELVKPTLKAIMEQLEFHPLIWTVECAA